MRLYITVTFKGMENKEEVEDFCRIASEAGFESFCFIRDIENYQKVFDNPKELMARSKEEVAKSDALFIDMTNKPTGRAIEAGIAYALNKKIIITMKKGTLIKDTSRGIADTIIEYENQTDLALGLKQAFQELNK